MAKLLPWLRGVGALALLAGIVALALLAWAGATVAAHCDPGRMAAASVGVACGALALAALAVVGAYRMGERAWFRTGVAAPVATPGAALLPWVLAAGLLVVALRDWRWFVAAGRLARSSSRVGANDPRALALGFVVVVVVTGVVVAATRWSSMRAVGALLDGARVATGRIVGSAAPPGAAEVVALASAHVPSGHPFVVDVGGERVEVDPGRARWASLARERVTAGGRAWVYAYLPRDGAVALARDGETVCLVAPAGSDVRALAKRERGAYRRTLAVVAVVAAVAAGLAGAAWARGDELGREGACGPPGAAG